jgi:hypothetical protein
LEERALNSTVAHIRAASPLGPRFDPAMTPEANRASPNLILLCGFHSTLIDSHEARYSVETIEGWKASQIAATGTEITDAESEQIIRESMRTEITLQADVINVGGQSGGGGGAIGPGAIGGRGGDSTRINLDGEQGTGAGRNVVGSSGASSQGGPRIQRWLRWAGRR